MTARLLVTGGGGFIGRHCLAPALAAGFEVWATTSTHSAPASRPEAANLHWRSLDLLCPGALEALICEIKPTHVLHMAWETTHGSYWTSPANLDWLALGTRLFKSFAEEGGKRLVCAGTCAEYDWSSGYMVEGVTPERPATFYGRIKLAHHQAMTATADLLGFSAATGRIFFAYGPYENPSRIIPYACAQLARGEPAEFGTGRFYRDFMHVEDVAAGFVALLKSDVMGACNIGSATPETLANIVTTIGTIAGLPEFIRLGARPDRPGDPPMLVGDNAKLRSTGWAPRWNLGDGLAQSFEWFRSQ
ncbi:NAD(P)-dependent oxidoreductase (plasmid) [Methylocystis sp. MJC1]|jgi:nucleoside-diphosphate-sugar epimerase|uniref:NAD-dependent epimerase/dehydratase family protein n=1 Tax=Methylocystis sp. MJC1 TaxID=2654282 RepID=UPI0013ECE0EB|nr:NAD(P)-dependent oxidoreductase [Methylocystis sp. MJC1]KAF2988875.1 GDP-6-deoxy-D-mannose reductase [Methylocystis sp. MJC1]MBU6529107.1 NAD(P)-dependent oxidoreductase [Methylocystis sp. MJC1]UZX14045.1 NAD(P)-dependent oxidoreductase [Methylocystis sp. MJC1]